jgi:hypothetical protein
MPAPYTDEILDSLRQVGDPVPDSIVEALAAKDQLDQVNQILRALMKNYQPIPEELPDSIEFWLKDTAHLPGWVDHDRLDGASALFIERGMAIALILSTAALVECYASQKGVKALTFSYRIGHNTCRRIAETSQFLLLVISPDAFAEGGQALPAIQKVRLMHSAIRYLIKQTGRWDYDSLGVPICQEDLLGTLMTFTYLVVEALKKIGQPLTPTEIDDYFYFWRVVGEMLGANPDYIPDTYAEAEQLTHLIFERHHGPSPEGVAMTQALLQMQADLIPGEAFDGIMPALIRYLVGDQVADWMEIPRQRVWDGLMSHAGAVGRIMDTLDRKSGKLADVADRLAVGLLTRQSIALNGYQRAGYEIPTALRSAWAERGKIPAQKGE